MEVIAKSKYLRISPRKLVLMTKAITGMSVDKAIDILANLPQKSAVLVRLAVKQAIGNAVNNFKLSKDNLVIKKIIVGKGPHIKRGKPVSRGQQHPILKRTSHLTLILDEGKVIGEQVTSNKEKKDGQ